MKKDMKKDMKKSRRFSGKRLLF
ncbi:hypothetical protein ELI_4505 [Eubacterium callanderi]|uniref:Uncharacterized protein n=1 Tax=Eubacterium callanderi TaxID=53442 RepID=E3GQZ7_9FIRM|nr:hypothetical protein ELI_4505 [Eubacterium callanderi]